MPLLGESNTRQGFSGGSDYVVDNSAMFNKADAEYLAADSGFGTPSNADVGTLSMWFKRGNLGGSNLRLFTHGSGGSVQIQAYFKTDNALVMGNGTEVTTTQLFHDTQAWYHLVVRVDTSQVTAADRVRHYLNGSQITSFSASSYPSQNDDVFTSTGWRIGSWTNSTTHTFDGYMSEVVYCDGQSLGPTSFGETDDNGVWRPIGVSGLTFGNNGFYLDFETTGSDLGDDKGNSPANDFTNTNSVTQSGDSPTNNHCVMSPIDKSSAITMSAGNLTVTNPSDSNWNHGRGTLFAPSGKWYYEWTPTAGTYALAGWMLDVSGNDYVEEETDVATTYYRGVDSGGAGFRIAGGSTDASVTLFGLNDVVMMAIDVDTMKMWVGINGTWYNSGDPANGTNPVGTWTAAIGESLAPWYGCINTTSETFNFGATSFTHTIPTGFNSWNTDNLPTPAIKDPTAHVQAVTYTGNGTAIGSGGLSVNQDGNTTFQPDLVWIKNADTNGNEHDIYDSVRGTTKAIFPSTSGAESTQTEGLTAFESDGFKVGNRGEVNTSTDTHVAWMWKAADAFSESSFGSNGLASTGRRNTTAGFSICNWTHRTSANYAIKHGLSTTPEFFFIKSRDSGTNWDIWHKDLVDTGKRFVFDQNAEAASYWADASDSADGTGSYADIGTGESPVTSTLFALQDGNLTGTDSVIGYFWDGIPGYSEFGTYTGNGDADGPFINLDFEPAIFISKRSGSSSDHWKIFDNKRNPFNASTRNSFNINSSDNHANAGTRVVEFLSNGFKIRHTDPDSNANGGTYIYAAWAHQPFGGSDTTEGTAV